jgi:hypothetical protein
MRFKRQSNIASFCSFIPGLRSGIDDFQMFLFEIYVQDVLPEQWTRRYLAGRSMSAATTAFTYAALQALIRLFPTAFSHCSSLLLTEGHEASTWRMHRCRQPFSSLCQRHLHRFHGRVPSQLPQLRLLMMFLAMPISMTVR